MAQPRPAAGRAEIAEQAKRAAYIATGALAILPLLSLFVMPAQAQHFTLNAPVEVTPARYALRPAPGRWPKTKAGDCSAMAVRDVRMTVPRDGALSASEPAWRRVIPPAVRSRLDQTRTP